MIGQEPINLYDYLGQTIHIQFLPNIASPNKSIDVFNLYTILMV